MTSPALPLVVADENIPQIAEALNGLAEVRLLPGRSITAADVEHATALFVRSITKVNGALLKNSRVQFVASATIGMDHIATQELDELGIPYTNAAGSNARSVVEYIMAALLEFHAQGLVNCSNLTLGIVGRGNIGRPLSQLARSLGMEVICNDPPLQQSGVEDEWGTLEEVFAESDVVTLHTPYTTSGPHATHHLIQHQHLELLGDRGILINAARGNVVRNIPLFDLLNTSRLKAAVLDCWENEPRLLPGLHELLLFGTPHIAGYSHDGKLEGTRQIVAAYARHLGLELPWKPVPIPPTQPMVTLSPKSDPWLVVREAVRHSYTIADDDAALRRFSIDLARTNPEMLEKHFDLLRKNYPLRREFAAYTITGIPHLSAEGKLLHTMGFQFS